MIKLIQLILFIISACSGISILPFAFYAIWSNGFYGIRLFFTSVVFFFASIIVLKLLIVYDEYQKDKLVDELESNDDERVKKFKAAFLKRQNTDI